MNGSVDPQSAVESTSRLPNRRVTTGICVLLLMIAVVAGVWGPAFVRSKLFRSRLGDRVDASLVLDSVLEARIPGSPANDSGAQTYREYATGFQAQLDSVPALPVGVSRRDSVNHRAYTASLQHVVDANRRSYSLHGPERIKAYTEVMNARNELYALCRSLERKHDRCYEEFAQ